MLYLDSDYECRRRMLDFRGVHIDVNGNSKINHMRHALVRRIFKNGVTNSIDIFLRDVSFKSFCIIALSCYKYMIKRRMNLEHDIDRNYVS